MVATVPYHIENAITEEKETIMTEPSKIVKGGFRATLALILSILALVVSLLAYSAAGNNKQLKTHIAELQDAMERLKSESARKLGDLQNETAKALEDLSEAVKKQDKSRESTGRQGN
jgi:hypothetical protein